MIVGYDARNAFRNSSVLGEYSRNLIMAIASCHSGDYRALLFAPKMNGEYRTHFISYANVSTYRPIGLSKKFPTFWQRFRLNPELMDNKVKVYHGLNEELPYGIGRDIKTVITCYGLMSHKATSFIDSIMWRFRMRYSFRASNIIVAVDEKVKNELVEFGVSEEKIRVIPMSTDGSVTNEIAEAYYDIYKSLIG